MMDIADDDDEEIVEKRDPAEPQDGGRNSPLTSMFGEVTIFRDFFFAAFSDGYNSVRGLRGSGDCSLFVVSGI